MNAEKLEPIRLLIGENDCVLIRNYEVENSDSLAHCSVARVKNVSSLETPNEPDRYFAHVEYYLRPFQLPPYILAKHLTKLRITDLIVTADPCHLVETDVIFAKCQVVEGACEEFELLTTNGVPIFHARWRMIDDKLVNLYNKATSCVKIKTIILLSPSERAKVGQEVMTRKTTKSRDATTPSCGSDRKRKSDANSPVNTPRKASRTQDSDSADDCANKTPVLTKGFSFYKKESNLSQVLTLRANKAAAESNCKARKGSTPASQQKENLWEQADTGSAGSARINTRLRKDPVLDAARALTKKMACNMKTTVSSGQKQTRTKLDFTPIDSALNNCLSDEFTEDEDVLAREFKDKVNTDSPAYFNPQAEERCSSLLGHRRSGRISKPVKFDNTPVRRSVRKTKPILISSDSDTEDDVTVDVVVKPEVTTTQTSVSCISLTPTCIVAKMGKITIRSGGKNVKQVEEVSNIDDKLPTRVSPRKQRTPGSGVKLRTEIGKLSVSTPSSVAAVSCDTKMPVAKNLAKTYGKTQSDDDIITPRRTLRTPKSRCRTTSTNSVESLAALSDSDLSQYDPSSSESDTDSDESAKVSAEEDAEDEVFTPSVKSVKKTPTRWKQQSNVSTPKTPRSAARKSQNRTASVPTRTESCLTPKTPLDQARSSLHPSAMPGSLPCRESEFEQIYAFIANRLQDGTGGCMYVSGVPGTGKTATVKEVSSKLLLAASDEEIPAFKLIEINGMKLTKPEQAYVEINRQLDGSRMSVTEAATALEKKLTKRAPDKEPIVLIADELDMLWNRKQNVLYHLFEWPNRSGSKMTVIAIANTMDLPERIMMQRVSSRLGMSRVTFHPYNYKQLQEIVASRLGDLGTFEPDAIEFISRKVAALSGDARRALDICRRAAEIAELDCRPSPSTKTKGCDSKKQMAAVVQMEHVNQTLTEMLTSNKINAMRNASTMEQFFLRAVVAEFHRQGVEEATLDDVYKQLCILCRLEGYPVSLVSEAVRVCLQLTQTRLVILQQGRNDLLRLVRLNCSIDDVNFALRNV